MNLARLETVPHRPVPAQPPAQAAAPVLARNERRRHARTRTYMVATLNYGRLLLPCFVLDLSSGGAKVKMFDLDALPAGPCELECGPFGKAAAEIAWYRGGFAGLKFTAPVALDPARFGG